MTLSVLNRQAPAGPLTTGEILDGSNVGSSTRSAPMVRAVWPVLGTVALATLLNPLNTSMIAVALVDLQRSFAVETGASTWLLSAFALTSAIAQPIMGRLAQRFGPGRVLLAGLFIVGATGLAAAWAPSFEFLVALRALQALGTSTGYPAGLVLLRRVRGSASAGDDIPPAWLGLISACGNASAALGPTLGGGLITLWGWRSIFLVNVPVTLIGAVAALRSLPLDSEPETHPDGLVAHLRVLRNRSLLKVYAQMVALSVVFYSIFFGLPLWLELCRGLTVARTGLMMVPVAGFSALTTPLAVRTATKLGSAWVLFVGTAVLAVGTLLMLGLDEDSSAFMLLALVALFGVPNAFNNLGLQADLTGLARAGELGTAGGFLQTARFAGAGLAAGLIGLVFAHRTTTAALHRLAVIIGVLSLTLLGVAGRRVVRERLNRTPAHINQGGDP